MGIQINGNTDIISATDGSLTIQGASGNLTGNLTGTATTAQGLTGTPNITVGTIGATSLNASGVVTATSFSGSGANLTGIAATTDVRTNSLVVSGITTVAAGSVSAPSITPTGDTDTGIFFPSADTIAFGEGGTEALRIDSSGNLKLSTAATSILNSSGNKILNQTGSILQVVQTVKTDTFTTNSTTPVDITGFNVSITPSSSSSKILVSWLINSSGYGHPDFYLMRGSTKLFFGDLSGNQTQSTHHWYFNNDSRYSIDALSGQYLDSPATTSSLTYKFQAAVPYSSTYFVAMNYVYPNQNVNYNSRTASSITVMEVAG